MQQQHYPFFMAIRGYKRSGVLIIAAESVPMHFIIADTKMEAATTMELYKMELTLTAFPLRCGPFFG